MDKNYNSKLQAMFKKYDTDNDESISTQELEKLLSEIVLNQEDMENFESILKEFDTDADGRINYKEFLMMIFDVNTGFKMLRGF